MIGASFPNASPEPNKIEDRSDESDNLSSHQDSSVRARKENKTAKTFFCKSLIQRNQSFLSQETEANKPI